MLKTEIIIVVLGILSLPTILVGLVVLVFLFKFIGIPYLNIFKSKYKKISENQIWKSYKELRRLKVESISEDLITVKWLYDPEVIELTPLEWKNFKKTYLLYLEK